MGSLLYRIRRVLVVDAGSGLLLMLATTWTALVAMVIASRASLYLIPLLVVPLGLAVIWLLRRQTASPALSLTTAWTAIVAGAVIAGLAVNLGSLILAIPALGLAAVLCARRPVLAVVAVFFITGAFGSLQAFLGLHATATCDALLAALWLGVVWSYLFAAPERRLWLWPGLVAPGVYLGLTVFEIFTGASIHFGLEAFRQGAWYMAAFVLVAVAPWPPRARLQMARGVAAVALIVGLYAVYRWLVGPAAQERAASLTSGIYNNLIGTRPKVFGSFTSGTLLGGWAAEMVPFCLACALTFRDRWRVLAGVACVPLAIAVLVSESRASLVAVVLASGLVLGLFQFARSLGGLRLGTAALVAAVITLAGAGAFAVTVGGSSSSEQRYANILNPRQDESFSTRLRRWSLALDDLGSHPLGHGLGTAGNTQARFGRYETFTGSLGVDNSYLRIALEQGFYVMIFYVVGLGLLLYGLARRAVLTRDRSRAALGIGAVGTLASLMVLMVVGDYQEGLTALAAWLVVGLGVSGFARVPAGSTRVTSPARVARNRSEPDRVAVRSEPAHRE